MAIACVAVFGGSGFVGRAIVNGLAATGTKVRVAVRHPDAFLGSEAPGGHVQSVYADVCDEGSVERALDGCDAAVNAVGLYTESRTESFEAVHENGARNLARQSARAGVKALVHISGIGADLNSPSSYVRCRARGEQLVKEAFKDATIFRPSVLFGSGDKFLNSLLKVTRWSPVVALFGAGATKLQPVYVGDLAEAALRALTAPTARGCVFELGGPQIYSFRALIELVLKETGRSRLLMPLPFYAWEAMARLLMVLPRPPLTTDVVTLMRRDNVVGKDVLTFSDLGLVPTSVETVLRVMLNSRP